MRSLVQDISKRLRIPPSEVEDAVSSILIRIRAELETIGEAEVAGLGTFRSVDGKTTFEPETRIADEINKEFSGMKPVALTATGESVDLADVRALPGSDSDVGDEAEIEDSKTGSKPDDRPVVTGQDVERELDGPDQAPESIFKSPPPPIPSKIRVPSGHKRSSKGRSRAAPSDEFPDMGSVVTTRPVQSIHTGTGRRRRSKAPMFVAAAAVVIGLGSWMVLGGGEAEPAMEESVESTTQTAGRSDLEVAENAVTRAEEIVPTEPTSEEPSETVTTELGSVPESQPEPEPEVSITETSSASVASEADTEPEEVVTTTETLSGETVSSDRLYAWIIASYTSQQEAEGRVDQLRDAGLDASVYEATVRGLPAYRVGLGHYPSEAAAWRGHDDVPPEAADAWITRVK